MQMIDLRPGQLPELPGWVDDTNSSCWLVNLHAESVFSNLGPFIDEVVADGVEGTWEEILESLREDEDGPRLDLNTEIFAHLPGPATVIASESRPVNPDSPQIVLAIKSSDEEALAAGIKKAMQDDPLIKNRRIGGTTVYYALSQDREDLPLWILAVARGHLLMATDFSALSPILEQAGSTPLSQDPLYQQSFESLDAVTTDALSGFIYYRLAPWLEVRYELLRAGQVITPTKTLPGMINGFLGGEPIDQQEPALDGSKLPPFEKVSAYFGILGAAVATNDTGGLVVGHLRPSKSN
jgi:hypothetical protein